MGAISAVGHTVFSELEGKIITWKTYNIYSALIRNSSPSPLWHFQHYHTQFFQRGVFPASYPREEKLYLCDTNHTDGGQEELQPALSYGSGTGHNL